MLPRRPADARVTDDAWRTALLESSLDCVIVMDAGGRVLDLNAHTERTFGVQRADVIAQRLADVFVPQELRAAHRRGLERYLTTGDSNILGTRVEVEALHASGRRLFVELSIVRLEGSDPPIFVGHLRNIEEQKRKERRLRASAAASRALASTSDAAEATLEILRAIGDELAWPVTQFWTVMPVHDRVQSSASWSAPDAAAEIAAAQSITSFSRGVGLPGMVWDTGKPIWIEDLRGASNIPRLPRLLEAGFLSAVCFPVHVHGHVVAVVEAFVRSTQEVDPQLLLLLEAIGGQLGHFIEETAVRSALAASDIRLREALEREQDARRAAEEANRAKDRFLAVVSHELRTPLVPILGWSKMLQSATVSPEQLTKALAAIARNAELQAHLVDDLLDMSRMASGKLTLAREPVDMASILQAGLDTLRDVAAGRRIGVDVSVAPGLPSVVGDAKRLHQILVNLLSNAFKFTPEGGRVALALAADGGFVELSVSDTGVGMDPATAARVFEPFWQAGSSRAAESSGLGLGLAIVKDLVASHGGTVDVSSSGPGRGATFRVRLPVG